MNGGRMIRKLFLLVAALSLTLALFFLQRDDGKLSFSGFITAGTRVDYTWLLLLLFLLSTGR